MCVYTGGLFVFSSKTTEAARERCRVPFLYLFINSLEALLTAFHSSSWDSTCQCWTKHILGIDPISFKCTCCVFTFTLPPKDATSRRELRVFSNLILTDYVHCLSNNMGTLFPVPKQWFFFTKYITIYKLTVFNLLIWLTNILEIIMKPKQFWKFFLYSEYLKKKITQPV